MALNGNLSTMQLPDLLQWLASARKTGTLVLERNKVAKRILVQEGRIVACASEEPADMLGHFLVSRGKISEGVLREALARQEREKRHLGAILVSLGAIEENDLTRQLETKAEEAIFGLFEWADAEFRFLDGEISDSNPFALDLRVEDILLRGAQRFDEALRIRTVFNDPGIVLQRTAKLPPAEVYRNRMARRIYESVDGRKTVEEILLLSHASEFLVTRFLYELFRAGVVQILEVRRTAALPTPAPGSLAATVSTMGPEAAVVAHAAVVAPPAAVLDAEDLLAGVSPDTPSAKPAPDPRTDFEVVRNLMSRGEFDSALEILNASYQAHPGDDVLRRLLAEAEAAFVEKAYRHYLPPAKILHLVRPADTLTEERLSPAEFFLLSRIDGTWDVRSIIQITPLREVDALRSLKRMREKKIIDVRDPA